MLEANLAVAGDCDVIDINPAAPTVAEPADLAARQHWRASFSARSIMPSPVPGATGLESEEPEIAGEDRQVLLSADSTGREAAPDMVIAPEDVSAPCCLHEVSDVLDIPDGGGIQALSSPGAEAELELALVSKANVVACASHLKQKPRHALNPGAVEFTPHPGGAVEIRPRHALNPGAVEFTPHPGGAVEIRPRAQGQYGNPGPSLQYPHAFVYQPPPPHFRPPPPHMRPPPPHFRPPPPHLRPPPPHLPPPQYPRAYGPPPAYLRSPQYPRAYGPPPGPPQYPRAYALPRPQFRQPAQGRYGEPAPSLQDPRASVYEPLGEGAHHLLGSGPQRQVHAMWRDNCDTELRYLKCLLEQGRRALIGFDTEYCAPEPATKYTGPPRSAAEWYPRIQSLVNAGDVVQMGLAVKFEDDDSTVHIFEINLLFDRNLRQYNKATLDFLEKSKHNLENHALQGVSPDLVAQWMKDNIHSFTSSTLVLFQADYDIGWLLRFALEEYMLPCERLDFLQVVRATLPRFYDVRVLGLQLLRRNERGFNLSTLGSILGVQRFGNSHGSGSDALLTLDCFLEIKRTMGAQIKPLAGVICGLYSAEAVVRSALPVNSDNLKMVEVWLPNFSENAEIVVSSFQSNYSFIGLLAEVENDLQRQETVDDGYTRFRNTVHRAQTVRIVLAMVSRDAQLAAGQICMFNISFDPGSLETGKGFIPAEMFNDVLLTHLLRKVQVTWITSHGAESVAYLCRCVSPLPPGSDDYLVSCSEMLPFVYDVALLSEDGNNQQCSIKTEKNSGEDEEDVVLAIRCFFQLLESRGSSVLEKSRGRLLPKPE